MKAVFLDYATMGADDLDAGPLLEVLPGLQRFPSTRPDQVAKRIRGAEYVLVNKVRLDADVLSHADGLRYIGLAATGSDNVSLDAARARNIAVSNIRAYCTPSVVEHVIGTLLSLTHSLTAYGSEVARGAWQRAESFCLLNHPLRELSAMRLGIVGYGTLGQAVGKAAEAFGMQLLIARRRGAPAVSGDGRVDFDDVLAQADVITLHCPLNASTEGLIGAAELAEMKRDAILINTARGGLVDSTALVDALSQGGIAAAAIDVLREEPPRSGDPLLDYYQERPDGNLLLTPHIAWATNEARQTALNELATNVRAFQDGIDRHRIV